MTPRQFAKIATSFPGTVEAEHMGHPDFRLGGKIFASLSGDGDLGMVKLNPTQQASFLETSGTVFQPCSGAWGRAGCTHVLLDSVTPKLVRSALELAYENIVEAQPKQSKLATVKNPKKSREAPQIGDK